MTKNKLLWHDDWPDLSGHLEITAGPSVGLSKSNVEYAGCGGIDWVTPGTVDDVVVSFDITVVSDTVVFDDGSVVFDDDTVVSGSVVVGSGGAPVHWLIMVW